MTMVDTLYDEHYGSREKLAFAFAEILNQEARELAALGVDVVQFDEPAFNVYFDEVRDWGVKALERARDGVKAKVAVHICYGYGIEANITWKKTLGDVWRQYEQTFPLLAKFHDRPGLARMRKLPRAHRTHRAPGGQGRARGCHRRGELAGRDARGRGEGDPRRRSSTSPRSAFSPAPTAAWSPSPATWRPESSRPWAPARHLFAATEPPPCHTGQAAWDDRRSMNNVMFIALGVGAARGRGLRARDARLLQGKQGARQEDRLREDERMEGRRLR